MVAVFVGYREELVQHHVHGDLLQALAEHARDGVRRAEDDPELRKDRGELLVVEDGAAGFAPCGVCETITEMPSSGAVSRRRARPVKAQALRRASRGQPARRDRRGYC